jgi:TonB family protein
MQQHTLSKIVSLLAVGLLSIALPNTAQATQNEKNNRCGGRSLEHLVVERVPPAWPPERGMRVAGNVVVKITIDENGKIVSARAICGHPLKSSFAVSAVIKWKFQPHRVTGKPKRISGIVTVHFPTEDTERNKDGKEASSNRA